MSTLATARQLGARGASFTPMSAPMSVTLPRDPRCGAIARRAFEAHAHGLIGSEALADAKLVIAELVNNAYLHGAGTIELRASLLPDRIRIEVLDEGLAPAIAVREPLDASCGGNGLRLVDSLALRWGARKGTGHVWVELPLSG